MRVISVAKILFAVNFFLVIAFIYLFIYLYSVNFLNDRNEVLNSNCLGFCLSNKNIFKILAGGGQSKQPVWKGLVTPINVCCQVLPFKGVLAPLMGSFPRVP